MIVAVALTATATRGSAQTDWRLDAALTRLRAVGASATSAASISAFAQQQIGPVAPVLSLAGTFAGDSVAAAQILMGVNVLPPWTGRAPIDIGAIVALYGIAAGDRGQSRTIYIRQHLRGEQGGYWVGAAIGQIERTAAFASDAFDAGVWRVRSRARFTAQLSTTRTNDLEVFQNTSFTLEPLTEKVRVADATATVEYFGHRWEAELAAGQRFAISGVDGTRAFANASLALRVTRKARIVVSAGSQLADPLRGTPQWRFASVGLRFASPPSGIPASRGKVGPPVEVRRLFDGRVQITVAAPGISEQVEIAGSFTGWQPQALERTDGGWRITLTIPAGAHRIQVRVNGADWRVPSNLPAESDEFGSRAGLIVIS